MAYDPAVVSAIRSIGAQRKVPRRWLLAALSTGLVESGLRNLPGGDADSAGWRQERASIYKDPTNVKASVNRFYDELGQFDKGQSVGELAAAVQRPAAQYRGRYAQQLDAARRLLDQGGGHARPTASSIQPTSQTGTAPSPTGAGTGNVFDYLASTTPTTNPLQAQIQRGWQLLSGLQNQRTGSTAVASSAGGPGISSEGAPAGLRSILQEANRIDAKNRAGDLPYKWGGGHAAKASPGSPITPLDCSGAVSRALGVDPRVSGQFAKWGEPGEGKQVTIYANDEHVLMKINGHFWGTSKTNPGGGAGWIPQSAISDEYLSRFTKRHPPGM